ncbi:hypothetical protein GCM10025734_55150 [Kitasatospora paranensis]
MRNDAIPAPSVPTSPATASPAAASFHDTFRAPDRVAGPVTTIRSRSRHGPATGDGGRAGARHGVRAPTYQLAHGRVQPLSPLSGETVFPAS